MRESEREGLQFLLRRRRSFFSLTLSYLSRAKGMLTSFDLSSKLKEGLSTPEFDEKLIKKMVSRRMAKLSTPF